jgi:PAS domain S-box-containing protein
MQSIQLCLENRENRRRVQEWLAGDFRVQAAQAGEDLPGQFDLAICDGPSLAHFQKTLAARKETDAPGIPPVLLIAAPRDEDLINREIGRTVDDIVLFPFNRLEFRVRVSNLLDKGRLSRELAEARQQLAAERARAEELAADLQAAREELQCQGEELQAQNEELTVQAEELQVQAEELRGQNKELQRLTQDLEAQRLLLETVLQQMPVGVILAEAPSGRFILANPRLEEIFHQPVPWDAGLEDYRHYRAYHADGRTFAPEDYPLARCLLTGQTIVGEELNIVRGDATWGAILAGAAPVRNPAGEIIAVVGVYEDISERKQAEAAIRRERDFSAAVLDTVGALVVVLDREGRIVRFNRACEQTTGFSFREVKRKPFWDIFLVPEEVRGVKAAFEKLRGGDFPGVHENHWLTKDGRRRLISWSNTAIPGDDGEVEYLIGTGLDVTERRQAEAEVERMASFPRLNPNPVLEVDFAGNITFSNAAARKTVEDLGIREGVKAFLPRDLAAILEEARKTGKRQVYREVEVGSATFAEAISFPGDLHVARIYSMDITERQRAEAALQRAKEEWEKTFDAVPDMIILLDDDHRILRANKAMAAALGLTPEAVAGQKCYEHMHRTSTPPSFCPHSLLLQDGREHLAEVHELDRDFLVSASPLHDPQGRVTGSVHVARDITERKRAEEALRQSEEFSRRIIESSSDCIKVLDLDGNLLSMSEGGRRLLEIADLAPYLNQSWIGFWQEKDRTAVADAVAAARACGEGQFQGYCPTVTGTPKWWDVIVTPILDPEGNPQRLLAVSRDITARRQAEEALREAHAELERRVEDRTRDLKLALEQLQVEMEERQQAEELLRESERRFAAFMQHLPGAALMKDRHGRYLYANETWEKLAGKGPGEWLGKTNEEIWPADVAKRLKDRDEQVLVEGRPQQSVEIFAQEDGPHYWLGNRFPILDQDGRPVMTGVIAIDITARHQAEEALAAERQRLYDVLEMLPAYVVLLAPDYHVPFANRYFTERFGESEGLRCYEYLFGRTEPCEICEAYNVLKTNAPQRWEWTGPDGRIYDTYDYPFTDADGSPLIMEMGIDITERKLAADALREKSRHLEAFFAHAMTPLVFLDQDFNFIRVNEAYARACRREVEGFPGHNHFEFYPHEENEAIFREVVRSKIPYQAIAKPFTFPDHPEWGVTYWDWTLTPIPDEQGEVDFLVFSLKDVTEQVKAEEARTQLIEIMEATPDLVSSADPHGRILYMNRAGRRLLGIGEDEDLSTLRIRDTHPEGVGEKILREAIPAAMREGVWQGETVFRSRRGLEIPTSQVILVHKNPNGTVKFMSTVVRDITERKQAEDELRRVNRAHRTLSEANQALVRATSEPALLNEICRIIVETGGYRMAWVGFAEADKQKTVRPVARAGHDAGYLDRLNITWADTERGRGPTGTAIRTGKPSGVWDFTTDPRVAPWRQAALERGYASSIVFPLTTQRRVWGALTMYASEPKAFSPEEMKLLGDLAGNLAYGINALRAQEARQRAGAALRESEKKLRSLTSQILTAQEKERSRLSREIHDELGQSLLVLKMQVRGIEKALGPDQQRLRQGCLKTLKYIDETIDNARRLSRDLSPSLLEDLGLTASLKHLLEEFSKHYGIKLDAVEMEDVAGLIPKEAEINIYRIFQESLTNIGKHAHPECITAAVRIEPGGVVFTVADNGAGFNVKDILARGSQERGLGLAAMDERVRMLGGSFHISSQKGAGTRITFTIPTMERGDR